jgi:hypothetical protein
MADHDNLNQQMMLAKSTRMTRSGNDGSSNMGMGIACIARAL